jgi:hypothetical protein
VKIKGDLMLTSPPPKRKAAGSIPAGRATISIGDFARDGAADIAAAVSATPRKYTGIQRTPLGAAGTAGTVLPFPPVEAWDPEIAYQRLVRKIRG